VPAIGRPSVTAQDVERTRATIGSLVRATPLLPSGELSRRLGAQVRLKAENLQITGSFKLRGATNRLAQLDEEERAAGVVAASAGNHAQAVAFASRGVGARATLCMPTGAALAKVAAVGQYRGEVRFVEGSYDEAGEAARGLASQESMTLVHAFDDPVVVAGQGTLGLEIAEEAPDAGLVVVPLGGGGLASGIAVALKDRPTGCGWWEFRLRSVRPTRRRSRRSVPLERARHGPSRTVWRSSARGS
jgi:threonine dehydratase